MTVGTLLRLIGFGLAGVAVLWAGGFLWFVGTLERRPSDPGATADAAVVLTGGASRLDAGFALLAEKRIAKLLISGVGRDTSREEIRKRADGLGPLFDCCVTLGREARDTAGNAIEAAVWAESERVRSIFLVTGAYHMPRSAIEFRRAMPAVAILPFPVFPARFMLRRWWEWPGTAMLIANEYTKYLFVLARERLAPVRPAAA